jgi:hypothetical protein
MFRPVKVEALPDYRLWVEFADGAAGEVDLRHLVGKGVFALWNDYAAFEQVYIGDVGQIAWSDTVDICPDAVYMQITGQTPEKLFPSLTMETIGA